MLVERGRGRAVTFRQIQLRECLFNGADGLLQAGGILMEHFFNFYRDTPGFLRVGKNPLDRPWLAFEHAFARVDADAQVHRRLRPRGAGLLLVLDPDPRGFFVEGGKHLARQGLLHIHQIALGFPGLAHHHAVEAGFDDFLFRRLRHLGGPGLGLQGFSFAQVLRQILLCPPGELVDLLAQAFQRLAQHLLRVLGVQVQQALVVDRKLVEQAVERFDALIQGAFTDGTGHFDQALDVNVRRLADVMQARARIDKGLALAFLDAQVALQGDVVSLQVRQGEVGQRLHRGLDHPGAFDPEVFQLAKTGVDVFQALDHIHGQGRHGLCLRGLLPGVGRSLGLYGGQGRGQQGAKRLQAFGDDGAGQQHLLVQVIDHVALIIGHGVDNVQRPQLTDRDLVFGPALVGFFDEGLAALPGGRARSGADLGVGSRDLRLAEIFSGVKAIEFVLQVADARRFFGLGGASAVPEATPAQAQAGIDKPLAGQVGLQQGAGARRRVGVDDHHVGMAVDVDFEPALCHRRIPLFPLRIEVQVQARRLVLGAQPCGPADFETVERRGQPCGKAVQGTAGVQRVLMPRLQLGFAEVGLFHHYHLANRCGGFFDRHRWRCR